MNLKAYLKCIQRIIYTITHASHKYLSCRSKLISSFHLSFELGVLHGANSGLGSQTMGDVVQQMADFASTIFENLTQVTKDSIGDGAAILRNLVSSSEAISGRNSVGDTPGAVDASAANKIFGGATSFGKSTTN